MNCSCLGEVCRLNLCTPPAEDYVSFALTCFKNLLYKRLQVKFLLRKKDIRDLIDSRSAGILFDQFVLDRVLNQFGI